MPFILGLAVLLTENRTTPRCISCGVFRGRSEGLSEVCIVRNERVLVRRAGRSALVDLRNAKRLAGQTHYLVLKAAAPRWRTRRSLQAVQAAGIRSGLKSGVRPCLHR